MSCLRFQGKKMAKPRASPARYAILTIKLRGTSVVWDFGGDDELSKFFTDSFYIVFVGPIISVDANDFRIGICGVWVRSGCRYFCSASERTFLSSTFNLFLYCVNQR